MTDFGADLVTTGLGRLLTGGAVLIPPVAKAGIDLGLDWYTSKVDAQVIADQATYVAGTQALWSTQIDAGLLSTPPAAFATAPTFNLDFPPQGLSDFGSSLWDSPTMGAFSPVPLDPSAFGTDFWSSCLPADPWGWGGMGDSNAFTVNFDPSSTWSSGGNLSSLTCSDQSGLLVRLEQRTEPGRLLRHQLVANGLPGAECECDWPVAAVVPCGPRACPLRSDRSLAVTSATLAGSLGASEHPQGVPHAAEASPALPGPAAVRSHAAGVPPSLTAVRQSNNWKGGSSPT